MPILEVAVGILTHEVVSGGREDLLRGTVESVIAAFPGSEIILLDNGSWDGTWDLVGKMCLELPIRIASSWSGDGTYGPGKGRHALQSHLLHTKADVFVCSDDDMVWKEGAGKKLCELWTDAPEDLILVSGLLEPEWSWNTPRSTVDAGGHRVLVRDSAPGAAWTYRRRHSETIFGGVERDMKSGEDFAACVRLCERYRVAQMDLAEHAGWGKSTLGNEAIKFAMPLDKAKWGMSD